MSSLRDAYTTSANTMSSFNDAADSAKGFHSQVQVLTKNLGSWAQIGADRTWCWPNHLQPSHLSDLAGGSAPIWAHEPKSFDLLFILLYKTDAAMDDKRLSA